VRLSRSSGNRRGHGRDHEPAAYGITTAEGSHLDDITKRQKQYALTMLFRIVAILVVVLVPGLSVLERVILGLVATIIPYVAVIRANGGPDQASAPTNLMLGGPRLPELPIAERGITGGHRISTDDDDADYDYADDGLDGDLAGDLNDGAAGSEPGRPGDSGDSQSMT
jgi:Protein of unknown function (DUF3099)